jgi:threonine synthase
MQCVSTRASSAASASPSSGGAPTSAASVISVSARESSSGPPSVSLAQAIALGLAPDGGLFVPTSLPRVRLEAVPPDATLAQTAEWVLRPFFESEPLGAELAAICRAAYTFEAPVRRLSPEGAVNPAAAEDLLLELFHGPTAAFKDFGARFLAECLARLATPGKDSTILVATSGDTGAAVAAAFHHRPGFRVVILYPDGRVSARQAHQLGAFGGNVHAFRVAGTFDDCQRLVKQALGDADLSGALRLGSANSISLGRLLPQMAYYAHAALRLRVRGPVNVVVPTGNLGNAMACLWAKAVGCPIGAVVLATNANRVLPDFLASGHYAPTDALATLANAMDVGVPSNLERLRHAYPELAQLRAAVSADWVDDETIRAAIVREWRRSGTAVCPHTACGLEVLHRLRSRGAPGTWLVAATAHPAKFETVVEPLVGQSVPPPPALKALLQRPSQAQPLAAEFGALRAALLAL